MKNTIPKIIHYCWFGGKEMPPDILQCVKSWEKLKDYKIMRWDETNCSFDENEFIKKAYFEKKYAFISDFYRLLALYKYGGFYLDTDVMVNKSFDDLLDNEVVLNFIFDCSVGSAVIGAQKGSNFIKELINMYYATSFIGNSGNKRFEIYDDVIHCADFETNNYYFTYYILKNYKDFKLNNKYQNHGDFTIYPKEYFEIGKIWGNHYTIHLCAGEWRIKDDQTKSLKNRIKMYLKKNEWLFGKIQIIVRKKRYKKLNKNIPFYEYSVSQKKGKELPLL